MKIMQNTKYVHHTIIPKQFKCRDCGCSAAVLLFLVQAPADKSGLHVVHFNSPFTPSNEKSYAVGLPSQLL